MNNPKSIWGKTPREIADYFKSQGYKTEINQSNQESQKALIIKLTEQDGKVLPITQIQYHPGGATHGESMYYKISTDNSLGTPEPKIKIIDASLGYVDRGETGVYTIDMKNFR